MSEIVFKPPVSEQDRSTPENKHIETLQEWEQNWSTRQKDILAIYGTSANVISKMLQKQHIPPYDPQREDLLTYQKAILHEQGKQLYYVTPLPDRFKNNRTSIEQKYPNLLNTSPALWDKMDIIGTEDGSHYASMSAISNTFLQLTGCAYDPTTPWVETLLYEVQRLLQGDTVFMSSIRDLIDDFQENIDRYIDKQEPLPQYEKIRAMLQNYDAADILRRTFMRRGVVIGFNHAILAHAHESPEAEAELLLIPEKPFGLDVVVGVNFLSPYDRSDAYNLLQGKPLI